MKPRTTGIIVIVALAVALAYRYSRTEGTIERCYRECELCGLRRGEVARMIQDILTSPLSREQQIELYESTAKDDDDVAPRLPCVEAVLDAAEEMKENTP